MKTLQTQPNENRCATTHVNHAISIPPCCPISGNPLKGSLLEICYSPIKFVLEVEALRQYVDSYKGGRGDVRSMEGMIQNICQDSADCVAVPVRVKARLNLRPNQQMTVDCTANPKASAIPL